METLYAHQYRFYHRVKNCPGNKFVMNLAARVGFLFQLLNTIKRRPRHFHTTPLAQVAPPLPSRPAPCHALPQPPPDRGL